MSTIFSIPDDPSGKSFKELLGERIRKLIKSLDLKDVEFAQQTGVTKATISGYVNGVREPSASFIANLVRVFRVSSHWLLTGEGQMFLGLEADSREPQPPEKTPFEREILTLETVLTRRGMSDREVGEAVLSLLGAGSPASKPSSARQHGGYPGPTATGHRQHLTVQEQAAGFGASDADKKNPMKE